MKKNNKKIMIMGIGTLLVITASLKLGFVGGIISLMIIGILLELNK